VLTTGGGLGAGPLSLLPPQADKNKASEEIRIHVRFMGGSRLSDIESSHISHCRA